MGYAGMLVQGGRRRLTVRFEGPVPLDVQSDLLLSGHVRKVCADTEPVDLAVVAIEGAIPDLRPVAYLARAGLVLYDPQALPPVEVKRAVETAWVGSASWVLPLEGPEALTGGVVFASDDLDSGTPRFSAAMPVNMEENDVERVLASFLPVAAEWVVGVDVKSTDGTLEIVSRYADVVFRFDIQPWSFAAARNETLRRASCPWIFQTEGHEHLDPESIGGLRQVGTVNPPQGVVMVERDTGGGNPNGGESFWFPWIFRNHPLLHFTDTGGVHNALEMEAYAKAEAAGEAVALRFNHTLRTIHKPHPVNRAHRDAQRHELNRGALDGYVEAGGARTPRALFYAAQEHASAGDIRSAVRRAIDYCRTNDGFNEQRYEGHLRLGEYLLHLQKPRLAIPILKRALAMDTNRVEALCALGDCYTLIRDLEAARQVYAMAAGVPMPTYANLFLRKPYYRALPWRGLASVCLQLGQHDKAYDAARCCLSLDPSDEVASRIVEGLAGRMGVGA